MNKSNKKFYLSNDIDTNESKVESYLYEQGEIKKLEDSDREKITLSAVQVDEGYEDLHLFKLDSSDVVFQVKTDYEFSEEESRDIPIHTEFLFDVKTYRQIIDNVVEHFQNGNNFDIEKEENMCLNKKELENIRKMYKLDKEQEKKTEVNYDTFSL